MSLVDMIAAAVCATLAGTGVGAGGLFIIYLNATSSLSQADAQAVNLAFYVAASLAALIYHMRHKRLNFPLVLLCAILGSGGTVLGSFLRLSLEEDILRKIFGIMLIFAGSLTFFRRKRDTDSRGK